MNQELMGVLYDLVNGSWRTPDTGEAVKLPVEAIEIEESLDGRESALVRGLFGDLPIAVVCDQITLDILARRVQRNIGGDCGLIVLDAPHSDSEHVERLRASAGDYGALVAVGSGTVNDLTKYATFLDGKQYCVFPTSPMNAYSTSTASITVGGMKQSIKAHNARGVFFDMEVLSNCPARLVNNALADVVCRTTAQVDWRMQRAVLGTDYSDVPYMLLAYDEPLLLASADLLHTGDLGALACLVRTCMLNGFGTIFTGTTHAGSMAEHLISHFLDNFSGDAHPGSLHGEQVGITTLTVLRLQNEILGAATPPELEPTRHTAATLEADYPGMGAEFAANIAPKILDTATAKKWNRQLASGWDEFAGPLREVMLPLAAIEQPMRTAGCFTDATELGFSAEHYTRAVKGARFLRDRFTILDLADDSGQLHKRLA